MKKYLYIDDESLTSIQAIADGLNDTKKILVECLDLSQCANFEQLTDTIVDKVSNRNIQGIILDMCLNGGGENQLSFTASPIAQQIRTLTSTGLIQEIPLILCSTDERIKETYRPDRASHDLYDYKFVKDKLDFIKVATKLDVLASAYEFSFTGLSIEKILGRKNGITLLDERIFERFNKQYSKYDLIHFLVKEIFRHPGILIDEEILLAKLGVDSNESSVESLNLLKDFCNSTFRYTGILSEGWTRYWSDKLFCYFTNLGYNINAMSAEQRVALLNKELGGINIVAAKPIKFNQSTFYDTICDTLRKPMDSIEGYVIQETTELKPWQEPRYVSFYALASGKASEDILSKNEKIRLKNTYELHSK